MDELLQQIAMIQMGIDPRRINFDPNERAHVRECLKASLDGAPPPAYGTTYTPKEGK